MSEFFFKLDEDERREVIQRAAVESGMPEDVLEKDLWLVWTLQKLFSIPNVPDMAFKGGTALSKVSGAIERFSEDVDVSVNYKALAPDLAEVDLSVMSKNARKQTAERLKKLLAELSHNVLVPPLKALRMAWWARAHARSRSIGPARRSGSTIPRLPERPDTSRMRC